MASAAAGYSSQEGLEEVLHLRVEVVSISRAKGQKLLEAKQWKSRLYRQARAEHSAIESLVFTLKEGFDGTAYQLACMLERDLALAGSPSFLCRRPLRLGPVLRRQFTTRSCRIRYPIRGHLAPMLAERPQGTHETFVLPKTPAGR
jgi:hypothetical protein